MKVFGNLKGKREQKKSFSSALFFLLRYKGKECREAKEKSYEDYPRTELSEDVTKLTKLRVPALNKYIQDIHACNRGVLSELVNKN